MTEVPAGRTPEEPGPDIKLRAQAAGCIPVGRIRFMDQQRVNRDGFAIEDPELGPTALRSPP